jgi:hypothetical protein
MSTVRRAVEAGGRRRKSRDALTSRPEVERLLNAASAPASPRELAGEHAAVDLFHRAHREPTANPWRDRVSPTPSARTGLKAALASAGAVALLSSGVAMAASGHAPWSTVPTPQAGAADSSHAADPSHPAHQAHPTHPAHPSGGPTDHSSAATGPNTHAFGGLCRAYTSGNKTEHGKALESPAFTALVTAAGGIDNVATFCGTVTAGPSGSHPTHPSHPTQAAPPPHPAHPRPPTQGSTPTHPTKPSHPTKGSTPTHPTHPTHPDHPTQGTTHTHG